MFAVGPDVWPTVAGLAAVPVLVAVNGFFVAAEFSLVAVRRTRVEELVNAGVPRAKALLHAVDKLDGSVAAAQLGITVASLALGFVAEPALHAVVAPLFDPLPESWQGPVTRAASVAVTLGLVTYLHVVFGEQMPKIAALQGAEKIGLWVAPPVNWFGRAFGPAIRLMNGSSTLFLRLVGFRPSGGTEEVHTAEELQMIIEDSEEAGQIDAESAAYLYNVFSLSDKKVGDIMVPWDKVMTLDAAAASDKILQAVRDGAHTRMPVTSGDPTNVVGVVNTKDLFYLFSLRGLVTLDDARYDAQYLSADDSVANALRLFRKSRRPMAIVRDASHKVLGILTLEDVLEEIIGDIEDEHDDPARRRVLQAKARRSAASSTFVPRLPPRA